MKETGISLCFIIISVTWLWRMSLILRQHFFKSMSVILYFTSYFGHVFKIIKPHLLPRVCHCDFSKNVLVLWFFEPLNIEKVATCYLLVCDRDLKYSSSKFPSLHTEGWMLESKSRKCWNTLSDCPRCYLFIVWNTNSDEITAGKKTA